MSNVINSDAQYSKWIKEISEQFKRSQIKAACAVNAELLKFYWRLGREIYMREKDNRYGNHLINKLSKDLRDELPDVKSFSRTNLYYMKSFYELYSNEIDLSQNDECLYKGEIVPQVGGQSGITPFIIPWGHNKLIIDKCRDNPDKALFFVKQTIENNWSRAVLLNFLDTDLYERQGKAITNFDKVLPSVHSDLSRELIKDPYNFDFITLRTDYDEKELEDALMNNIQKLLMELGKGFAFVGREYRLVVGNTEQFIDLLFYNIPNHCYVVVEVKVRDFEPGDMGQLGTYIGAVDGLLKSEGDNNTIGLLICKTKDNVLAQYAVNMINAPVGISEYELSTLIPKEYKGSMPTIEEIENELKDKTDTLFESAYGGASPDFFSSGRVQGVQEERDPF